MTLAETWLAEGMEKGVQQGIKEGKHRALLQVAEAMRKRGIDDAAIMEMTGLAEDELAAASPTDTFPTRKQPGGKQHTG
ncbi:hypothetical protein LNP17_01540 [Klebsiella variicola subsp. variicola]|nr:hypothetical protein [Klebsiella variicola subsp. variicola]